MQCLAVASHHTLQLANGEWCEMAPGATTLIAGKRLSYGCARNASAGSLDRSSEPWTVALFANGRDTFKTVQVLVAWGG